MIIVESRHWKGASNARMTARQAGSSGFVQMSSIADSIALVTKDEQLDQRVLTVPWYQIRQRFDAFGVRRRSEIMETFYWKKGGLLLLGGKAVRSRAQASGP